MTVWRVKHRDRRGRVSTVGHYATKREADARVIRITRAQRRMGAFWATPSHESFGHASAVWRDGTYTETWRAALRPHDTGPHARLPR